MKWLQRIAALALVAALALAGTAFAAENLPQPDPELLYVTDEAGVLSDETAQYIVRRNDALCAATGAQFAVLTVPSLPDGYDSESYCYAVFNDWGIGSAQENNGLLLLLVPQEERFWMTVGTGLDELFSGGTISDMLDTYLAPDFDAGRYDEAVTALFDAVWEKLEGIYGPIDESTAAPASPAAPTPEDGGYDEPAAPARPSFLSRFLTGAFRIMSTVLILILVIAIIVVAALVPGRRYYYRRRHMPPPPPPPPGGPYYRAYRPRRPARRPPPPPPPRPVAPPPPPVHHASPPPSRSSHSVSRPSGGRSFGGGRSMGAGHSSSAGRSMGGGRSHGGGAGRR